MMLSDVVLRDKARGYECDAFLFVCPMFLSLRFPFSRFGLSVTCPYIHRTTQTIG